MKKRVIAFFLIIALIFPSACAPATTNEDAAPDQTVIVDPIVNDTPIEKPSENTPQNVLPSDTEKPQETQKPSENQGEKQEFPSWQRPSYNGSDDDDNVEILETGKDDSVKLWLSPVVGKAEKSRPISAVRWQYNDHEGRYYIYLPTQGKISSMQVWFEGTTICKFGDRTVKNGDTVNFLQKGETAVLLGYKTFPLTIMKSANIGSMYITTKSGSMSYIHKSKDNEETGVMQYVDANGKQLYSGNLIQIRGRGNATWSKDKKPYQIKLENKAELVDGAGVATTWLLLANYCEKTMLNNTVALNLAYDAGMTETARFEYMDLYCNNKYMGTYQVCEKVQIAESRLEYTDLAKETKKVNALNLGAYSTFGTNAAEKGTSKGYNIPKDPKDITGGYLLEVEANDRYENETAGFVTNNGVAVVIKEPEHPSPAQVAYISNYFQEFEDAIRAKDGINPTTGKRFDQYFDLTSLAKKYILEEFVKNIDADKTSQYFYKPSDKESKVGFCGPVWDYDNSFDVMTNAASKNGLYANTRKKIFYYLCKHDLFMNEVKKYWRSEYLPGIAVCLGERKPQKDDAMQSLDYYYNLLSPSADMNYTFWGNVDFPINSGHVDTGDTYKEHFEYLETYLKDRREELNWIWLNE